MLRRMTRSMTRLNVEGAILGLVRSMMTGYLASYAVHSSGNINTAGEGVNPEGAHPCERLFDVYPHSAEARSGSWSGDIEALRNPFQRDYARVLRTPSFRNLMYKTQVFILPWSKTTRTRLTHTLEVEQIARTIAECLHINQNLTEVIATAHDIGHAPFGHDGEEILKREIETITQRRQTFDHNVQALRVVGEIEGFYPHHCGLNLCRATLEGIASHGGGVGDIDDTKNQFLKDINQQWRDQGKSPLEFSLRGTLEAQAAAAADAIAYVYHDLQDGVDEGFITLDDIRGQLCAHMQQCFDRAFRDLRDVKDSKKKTAWVLRCLIDETIQRLLGVTQERLDMLKQECGREVSSVMVSHADTDMIPSEEELEISGLKEFLRRAVYIPASKPYKKDIENIVTCLFQKSYRDRIKKSVANSDDHISYTAIRAADDVWCKTDAQAHQESEAHQEAQAYQESREHQEFKAH